MISVEIPAWKIDSDDHRIGDYIFIEDGKIYHLKEYDEESEVYTAVECVIH